MPAADDAPFDQAETLALASGALGRLLTHPTALGGSDRSLVLRCASPDGADDGGPRTVVVKRFPRSADGRDGYVRERTGLALLPATPDLLAADDEHHLLVMTDLGDARTLADVLLDVDAPTAWDAAVGWAGALGAVLAASRDRVEEAEAALAAGGALPWDPGEAVRGGAARLVRLLGEGAAPSSSVESELTALLGELRPDPGTRVVSPGDTCPDNALLTGGGWTFFDLEGTTVHHVALDAAYAMLPFASCWCVFASPPDLTDRMLDAFTVALAPAMPDVVGGPGWRRTVDLACAAWVLAANAWLVDGAIADRPSVGPAGRTAPSFRALLTARWRWGSERLRADLPATAALLTRAAEWADDAWGEAVAELPPYPAFRGGAES